MCDTAGNSSEMSDRRGWNGGPEKKKHSFPDHENVIINSRCPIGVKHEFSQK